MKKTIQCLGYTVHLRPMWVVQIEGFARCQGIPLLMGGTEEEALANTKDFIEAIKSEPRPGG